MTRVRWLTTKFYRAKPIESMALGTGQGDLIPFGGRSTG